MGSFTRIGILHQPQLAHALPLGECMAAALTAGGCGTPWIGSSLDDEAMAKGIPGSDLIITLGGDGSILRAARLAAPYDIPILGIKLGRLGFLAEVNPEGWEEPFAQMLAGDYWIEERMRVRVEVQREGETDGPSYTALNDAVVSRGSLARLVRVAAYLNEAYLTTYIADGVIVSTATGSTAYALAVGGPILPPELKNILVLPIAPHLSMQRPVVVDQGTPVRLQVFTSHRAILNIDGQKEVELHNEDNVIVTASANANRFIRLRERNYFYRYLMEKLKWTV